MITLQVNNEIQSSKCQTNNRTQNERRKQNKETTYQ